jgi:O-antigen/teichoic acid export membrane protein
MENPPELDAGAVEPAPVSPPAPGRSYRRELLFNQVWQALNFISKAAFLGLLTPLMLHTWGAGGYGLFALASSLLVSLAILDCGVRSLTRLRLCDALARNDRADFSLAVGEGAAAFGLMGAGAFAIAAAIALLHGWSRWLNLPPEGDFLIAMTVGLVAIFMLTVLLLEPLAARGRVSALKAANTVGALAAIPVVALAVWRGSSVTAATFIYFVCLTAPNLVLLVRMSRDGTLDLREWRRLRPRHLASTLHAGGWFYVTTLALIAKTHALTFVVSAISGPAAAGTFYILLRITEIVGGLGATSSDTSLASLANEPSPRKRAENFRHGYLYALVFCLHGTLVLGFLTPLLLRHWLATGTLGVTPLMAWAMAIYGLSGAFSKVVVNAAMGTGLVSQAAIGNLIEAVLVLVSGLILQAVLGLTGLFVGASLAAVALFPAARLLARNFGETPVETWLEPIRSQAWPLLLSALVLAAAWWAHALVIAIGAVGFVGALVVLSLKRLHK